jgi:ribosomal protein L13E
MEPKILKPGGRQRIGRGFSPEELRKAGLNKIEAVRLGIPADLRRKTVHDENVEALKACVEKKKAKAKPKPRKKPEPGSKKKPKS